MKRLLPVLLAAGLVAACGGGDDPTNTQAAQAPPAQTPAQTAPPAQASAAPTATGTPPPAAATASASPPPARSPAPTASATPSPEPPADAPATPTPDKRAIAKLTPAPTAPPPKHPPKQATPTPTPKPKADGPLLCLQAANLKKPRQSGAGLWAASLGADTDLLAVDGPYPSPRDAQISVEGLAGFSDAEVGGNYVVSANASSKAKATVHKVADCLDARDS